MSLRFTLSRFEFFVLKTRTRFPFRYGIASMTEVPHLFLRTHVTIGEKSSFGVTAEGLPPKWFTKNPNTTFEQDLPEMMEVIRNAANLGEQIAQAPVTFFEFWRELYQQQTRWAASRNFAALLANLGVSLVERAVLDGICRVANQPLHQLLVTDEFGINLGEIHPQLAGTQPRHYLPSKPLKTCFVRHTIGLGDALSLDDISAGERINDGLPQDLESSIRAYGLRYFKVKLNGSVEKDFSRLRTLKKILLRETQGQFWLTLDGNENFHDFAGFREFWMQVISEPELKELCKRVLVVEQPVHRDQALSDAAALSLREWKTRPPIIIDESDGAVGDLPRALELGYAGTSYKNCKGIVKGISNACLLENKRRQGDRAVLTGEDLCTLGPVVLLQDLAMMSLLGVEHVERNGHHYYRGLSMFPNSWQETMLEQHSSLYERDSGGFARLQVRQGEVCLDSINRAPFGVLPLFDPGVFSRI